MPDISQAWIALIGALLGGSGLKIIEAWLGRSKQKADTQTEFRNELRGEVIRLHAEATRLDHELDAWKAKYYSLLEEYLRFRADMGKK